MDHLIKKISSKIGDHDIINAHNHPAQWISKFTDIPTVWMCNEPHIYSLPALKRLNFFYNQINLLLPMSI